MKQDPQNGDLKKQIHERQSRIAALNERQKLPVRSCSAAVLVGSAAAGNGGGASGSTKQPALLKAPAGGGGGGGGGGGPSSGPPSVALSVLPSKGPVAMVTAHLNGGRGGGAQQSAPINLQTKGGCSARRAPAAPGSQSQALGTIAAVPITVPQVSSLQRLAGHRPAVLPQVRPKTLIPDSLPISPCRDQPSKQPSAFQKATVVSIKNPTPALPTANNTVSHVQTPNSQSQSVTESTTTVSAPLSTTGVAYAIISTSPNNAVPINTSATVSVVNDGIKVQPLLISADSKVIIIQPQVQTQTENKVETKKAPEESAQGPPATKKKKEESPETPSVHSLASENCLYGSIRPGYNRILGRNPKQASGEEKKKHSQPGLQWAFGNREETSCIKLFEQPLVSVHKRMRSAMMNIVQHVSAVPICNPVEHAPEPITSTAWTLP
uniref:PHD finger protein 21B n=1 Tax=Podarcis muralis TaxID=64176 RepID=A0A670HR92_PODMU